MRARPCGGCWSSLPFSSPLAATSAGASRLRTHAGPVYLCRVNDTSPLLLQYRPDLHLLVGRWQDGLTTAHLQAGYQDLLRAGQQYGAYRWLIDVRRRPIPTPEQARWITHEWLPEAAAASAPQRLRLAYLLSPTYEHNLRNDPAVQSSVQAISAPNLPYTLKTFTDEGTAMQWLVA